jgi:rhodanese-related sulfurtransferase/CBS domain-containing protein
MADITPKDTDREGIRLLLRRGGQLVEVLPREEFERVHLAGASSLPLAMISRSTANRLQWDKPVIVYAAHSLDDRAARAAWRLASLGFTQVFRYSGGKADWLANGLPVEGAEARKPGAGDLADLDVPTCKRGERVDAVRKRVGAEGWDTCVVINDDMVVLGVLSANDLTQADQSWPAEEAMQRDPQTYRLDATVEDVKAYFLANRGAESVLVTTPDGKLYGMIKRDAEGL